MSRNVRPDPAASEQDTPLGTLVRASNYKRADMNVIILTTLQLKLSSAFAT
jgi:hypothetical protein